MKRVRGFTLIELMIVVAIIAILAGIALTAYNKQVRKSRRAEAKEALADLTLKQEKYRVTHATYGAVAAIGGAHATSYYTICPVVANCTTSATGYKVIAVPKSDQATDPCGTLYIENVNGVVTKYPLTEGCWN